MVNSNVTLSSGLRALVAVICTGPPAFRTFRWQEGDSVFSTEMVSGSLLVQMVLSDEPSLYFTAALI